MIHTWPIKGVNWVTDDVSFNIPSDTTTAVFLSLTLLRVKTHRIEEYFYLELKITTSQKYSDRFESLVYQLVSSIYISCD